MPSSSKTAKTKKTFLNSSFLTVVLVALLAAFSAVFALQQQEVNLNANDYNYAFAANPEEIVDFSVYEAIDPTQPINCGCNPQTKPPQGCYSCKQIGNDPTCGTWSYDSNCGSTSIVPKKICNPGEGACDGQVYYVCDSKGENWSIRGRIDGKCGYRAPRTSPRPTPTPPGARCESPDDSVIECASGFCCTCTYADSQGRTVSDNRCLDTGVANNCNDYCAVTLDQRREEGLRKEQKYGNDICATGNAACQGKPKGTRISIANGLCECQGGRSADPFACGCVPIKLRMGESCSRGVECDTGYCGDGICQAPPKRLCQKGEYICNSARVIAKCNDEFKGYIPLQPEIACNPSDPRTVQQQLAAFNDEVQEAEKLAERQARQSAIEALVAPTQVSLGLEQQAQVAVNAQLARLESFIENAVGEIGDAELGDSCATRVCSPGLVCDATGTFAEPKCETAFTSATRSLRGIIVSHYNEDLDLSRFTSETSNSIMTMLANTLADSDTSKDQNLQNYCTQVQASTCDPKKYKATSSTQGGLTTTCSCVKASQRDSVDGQKINQLCSAYQKNFVQGLAGNSTHYYQERCTTTIENAPIPTGSAELACTVAGGTAGSLQRGVALPAENCNGSARTDTISPLSEGDVCCLKERIYAEVAPSCMDSRTEAQLAEDIAEGNSAQGPLSRNEQPNSRCIAFGADENNIGFNPTQYLHPDAFHLVNSSHEGAFDINLCYQDQLAELDVPGAELFSALMCCKGGREVFKLDGNNLLYCEDASVEQCSPEIDISSQCIDEPLVNIGGLETQRCTAEGERTPFNCCPSGYSVVSDSNGNYTCIETARHCLYTTELTEAYVTQSCVSNLSQEPDSVAFRCENFGGGGLNCCSPTETAVTMGNNRVVCVPEENISVDYLRGVNCEATAFEDVYGNTEETCTTEPLDRSTIENAGLVLACVDGETPKFCCVGGGIFNSEQGICVPRATSNSSTNN